MISGGYDGTRPSGCIREVQLVPPYTVKTLSRMLEPRQYHCMERFDDSLLIVGGRTTSRYQDSTSSVVLYDIMKKRCKQMTSLPYPVSRMATVRWGDNIVVVGGIDKHGNALNTVLIYNVKTEQSHMLPTMKYRRWACTAVVIGNNIVVLGGQNEQQRRLKSVEVFNFESYTWQDLPEMSEGRFWHSAVVV
jgi:N-acetylneuraminic acid mutarotase